MVLRVSGDLNEKELAAITSVLEQAQKTAKEFFGGDIGAAFNQSQDFEFDAEQLARVRLCFRMHQVTNVSYAEVLERPAISAAEPPLTEPQPAPNPPLPAPPADGPAPVLPVDNETIAATPVNPEPDAARGATKGYNGSGRV